VGKRFNRLIESLQSLVVRAAIWL